MWVKTNTSLFMLRPLGLVNLKEAMEDGMVNCCKLRRKYGVINAYLKDSQHETDLKRPVFVLFKPTDLLSFDLFLREEYDDKDSGLIEDYDYPGGFVVLLYKFPKGLEADYDCLLLGKYSETSDEFKKRFPLTQQNGEPNIFGLVFTKDKRLKKKIEEQYDVDIGDMEVWDIFDIEKETLNIDKITKSDTYDR